MAKSISVLEEVVDQGEEENGSIEFKKRLREDVHLQDGKFESLTAQLRHRILSGDGEATYVIGVTDDGGIDGVPSDQFSESLDVLSLICEEADAHIANVDTWGVEEDRLVGLVTVKEGSLIDVDEDHIVIGTAGHVDHGKSTLIGSLITGQADNGAGEMREYLDTRPHEVERGLSATLSHAVYGFDESGDPMYMDDPLRETEQASVVEGADRLVSFVDTVGHEPWLRTTIRGLVGQRLDYGLLTVAADDGPTQKTREHLGILLATELPTIVAITKSDIVDDDRVEMVQRTVERHLRDVGKTPLRVETYGTAQAVEEMSEDVVPIIVTSAVTRNGLDELNTMFQKLPKRKTESAAGDFKMYVDRVYEVTGVGAVVSGSIKSGTVNTDDSLLIGPFKDGSFREVEARSIEFHHYRVDEAKAGQIVGINLTGVSADELDTHGGRGMVLLDPDTDPEPVWSFEAELMVLNHPTSIKDGYEPVVHLETLSETARIYPEDEENLLPGDTGKATVEFKFNPCYVEEGQKFIFREGKAKGVGTVVNVEP